MGGARGAPNEACFMPAVHEELRSFSVLRHTEENGNDGVKIILI